MTGSGKVNAESMARAVLLDRQFRLPKRPKFITDLAQVWGPDYLLIDGTGELQVLRGSAVRGLLPTLIPLLDGDRTVDEVVSALPNVARESAYNAIALLYTRGLLEDAEGEGNAAGAGDADAAGFFRRHVDTTRVNRCAAEALNRLADSQVFVLRERANGPAFELVIRHLRNAGVGTVTPLWSDRDLRRQIAASRVQPTALVAALLEDEETCSILPELDDACADAGIPWLRTSIPANQHRAEIGPYFERHVTPCYHCFGLQNRGRTLRLESHQAVPLRSLQLRMWADMLAMEAIYLLSRIAPAASGIGYTIYDTVTWSSETLRLAQLPGCARCRRGPGIEVADEVEPALLYEDSVSFPPRHLMDPKAHQAHYHTTNVSMALECKTYPGVRVLPLPPVADLPKPAGDLATLWGEGRSTPLAANTELKHIAALLLLAGGIRERKPGDKPQRWTATGGNLGSVELYLAAASVDGLEAGVYYYDSGRHALARLPGSGDREEVTRDIREWTADAVQNAAALVIAVGALHRVYRKYGPFAYRVIHLDAGIATAQMHLAAQSIGIAARNVEPWIDHLISRALRLSEDMEYVTAVVRIAGEDLHDHK